MGSKESMVHFQSKEGWSVWSSAQIAEVFHAGSDKKSI